MSISHYFQLKSDFPVLHQYLKELQDYGELKSILSSNSIEDFIIDRQRMYQFDRHRYSFYFDDKIGDEFPEYNMVLDESTTAYIKRKLESIISGSEQYSFLDNNKIIDLLWQRVNLQDNNAYTSKSFLGLFETDAFLAKQDRLVSRSIFKKIELLLAILHNNCYLEKSASSIIVNIPFVDKYDIMMPSSTFDYKVYMTVLQPLLTCLNTRVNSVEKVLSQIIAFRNDSYFPSLCEFLNQSIMRILMFYRQIFSGSLYSAISDKVIFDIEKSVSKINLNSPELSIQYAYTYFSRLFSMHFETMKAEYSYNQIDPHIPRLTPIDEFALIKDSHPFEKHASINNNYIILKAEVTMGDTYNANQVGMQGPNSGSNATITQIYSEKSDVEFDYIAMSREITKIKSYLRSEQSEQGADDRDILIGELTKLNQAFESKDNIRILDVLKACGLKIVDIGKRLGCSILVGYILKKLGK